MQVYTKLRQESALSHGMPIAVRHLESMIRMSEAHATMRLSSYVSSDDIDVAVRWVLTYETSALLSLAGKTYVLVQRANRCTAVSCDDSGLSDVGYSLADSEQTCKRPKLLGSCPSLYRLAGPQHSLGC